MASLYTPTLTYNPITDPQGARANHYQIERSPGDGFIYEAFYDPHADTSTTCYRTESLIIATAGSFMHEKFCYPGPRASYSVFFGPGNDLNDVGKSLITPPGAFQSRQRGDLSAAISALRTVVQILKKGLTRRGPISRVIIKTDSEYLIKGVTEWVYTWVQKGWIRRGNSRVKDWDLWEQLLDVLDHVKLIWGVEVAFWWVPPKWNRDAKSLAGLGLRVPPPTVSPTTACDVTSKEVSRVSKESKALKDVDVKMSPSRAWLHESCYVVGRR
ncbi:Ribonuclease H [Cytospora mali]|uniref:ribonuclease H n=1 Tax=Cytospora mali TaxID=578113 RepID=A0A194UPI8_CYTMA|nr:Ribonuclease H [Valsa mali var. pyri (nom. inval.)]